VSGTGYQTIISLYTSSLQAVCSDERRRGLKKVGGQKVAILQTAGNFRKTRLITSAQNFAL